MFSIAQLLLPVSAEQVCGEDLSFSSEVDEIARARTFDDPTLEQGAWVADIKEADWHFVCRRCAELIATRSKDVRLAVWLAEAQAKTAGLRGLGDGYAVLAGLCEHYWQGLYPQADEGGDDEQRIGNLFWLLNRTPSLVREMAFDGGLAPLDEVEYCLAMLGELERVADLRLGAAGPGFGAARDAVQALLRGRSVGNATTRAAAAPEQTPAMAQGGQGSHGPLQNRTQALLQLRMVADFFRRTEPHSPVAYLADKAADWGDMPLHLWLRAVVRDQAAIAELETMLGCATDR
ncbi:MAG: type VI secretion system protein TssA [Duganella sp.]